MDQTVSITLTHSGPTDHHPWTGQYFLVSQSLFKPLRAHEVTWCACHGPLLLSDWIKIDVENLLPAVNPHVWLEAVGRNQRNEQLMANSWESADTRTTSTFDPEEWSKKSPETSRKTLKGFITHEDTRDGLSNIRHTKEPWRHKDRA